MWAEYRCDIDDCGYQWTGPRYLLVEVRHRHQLKRHEALAEAEALLRGETLPTTFKEHSDSERSCICITELGVLDLECPVHRQEAVW